MKKTEMMKRYEAETGEILDIDHLSADANGSWYGYIEELEAELRGLRMLNKWSKEEIIQYRAKATTYDRLMTLNEAITHCKENVQKETQNGNLQCAIEHNQLAMWLSQLEEAKAKAAAYDRLMSGGKKTLKEWANLLGKPIAVDVEGRLLWFPKKPEIGLVTWILYDEQFGCFGEELPKNLIDFNGDWKDSLTLPDEWEVM